MTLLYDVYERIGDEGLSCILTSQSIRLLDVTRDGATVDYRDREISLSLPLTFRYPYNNRRITIDWNGPTGIAGREGYGLWRRVTWFLMDALIAWGSQRSGRDYVDEVEMVGGWSNGVWNPEAGCSTTTIGAQARDRLIQPFTHFAPFPLDRPAPTFVFEPGLEGAREGRIAAIDIPNRLPLADLAVPVVRQLADVPRFVGSDGTIFFFHKVDPFTGPDYAGSMDYGVITDDAVLYVSQMHGSLRRWPIRLRPDVDDSDVMVLVDMPYPSHLSADERRMPSLHPRLREQQFFASAAAHAVAHIAGAMPRMSDLERNREIPFGYGLGTMSYAPLSNGATSCRLRFHRGDVAWARG